MVVRRHACGGQKVDGVHPETFRSVGERHFIKQVCEILLSTYHSGTEIHVLETTVRMRQRDRPIDTSHPAVLRGFRKSGDVRIRGQRVSFGTAAHSKWL